MKQFKMATKRVVTKNEEEANVIQNDLVLHLDDVLVDEDLKRLKYLFKGCPLHPRQLEKIKSVTELFQELENNQKISLGNYKFLTERLRKINRKLATEVEKMEREINEIWNRDPSPVKKQRTGDESQQQPTEIHPDLKPLIASTINRIKKEKEEKKFLETKAFHDAQDHLQKNRVLVIKGNTGDGKTSTAIQLIHWLLEKQQCRQALQLHEIKQLDLLAPNSHLVTFIDDSFGEKDIGRIDVQEWNKRLGHVKTLFVNEQIHANFLLITIRNEIFNVLTKSSLGEIFIRDNIIDLSSVKYIIKEEKRELLEIYKPKNFSWQEEEKLQILYSAPDIGFPQCCQIFCKSEELQEKRVEFFMKPFQFFIDVLSKLPECSAILFLFLNDGKIKVKDLDPNGDKVSKTLLEQAFKINLVGGKVRTTMEYEEKVGFVKESLDSLLEFLVRKETSSLYVDEVYRFDHYSIYHTVALLYWKITPAGYIQNCPRTALGYLKTSHISPHMNVISHDNYEHLCKRLLHELDQRQLYDNIVYISIWKDDEFLERFVMFLMKEREVSKIKLLNIACNIGIRSLAYYLLHEGVRPDEATNFWRLIKRGEHAEEDILEKVFIYLNEEMKLDLLNDACCSGSEECVLYLLDKGVKPDKDTPLWTFIKRFHGYRAVDVLEEVVVYLNDEMKLGLLNEACACAKKKCAFYLLEEGVKPDKDTPLWSLITNGDRSGGWGTYCEKKFLDILKKVVEYFNEEIKLDLLNKACHSGFEQCALYLLCEGVKPDGFTLIQVVEGHARNMNLFHKLLEYGITPTARDSRYNNNALHVACKGYEEEMVSVLCKTYPHLVHDTNKYGQTPLHVAAEERKYSMFQTVERTVLKSLCRVEDEQHKCETVDGRMVHRSCACSQYMSQLVDNNGRTVLHLSCMSNSYRSRDVCVYLCESYPALTTAVDKDGRTALHLSCMNGHREICVYLCELYPALTTAVDKDGRTALHLSCMTNPYRSRDVCVYLCESYQALTTVVDKDGRTALHLSCMSGCRDVCVYLCESYPALTSVVDKDGRTALHLSCLSGHRETCVYLCESYPALTTAVDKDGRTALHLSCMSLHRDVCVYMCESYPALTTVVDNDRRHCLHYIAMEASGQDMFDKCETHVKQYMESIKLKYDITTILDMEGKSVLDLARENTEELLRRYCNEEEKEEMSMIINPLYNQLVKVFKK